MNRSTSLASSLVIFAAGAVTACAGGAPFTELQPPPEGSAQIYVYRTARATQNAMPKKVAIDGGEPASLQNGAWMRVVVPTGRHTVSIAHYLSPLECKPLTVELGAGQSVFVETWTAAGGYAQMVVTCFAEIRPADVASAAMQGLRSAD